VEALEASRESRFAKVTVQIDYGRNWPPKGRLVRLASSADASAKGDRDRKKGEPT
jgi:hypothetical protein